MNKHYPRFDCAGGMLPSRKPRWDAMPLIKAVTILCAILALGAVW